MKETLHPLMKYIVWLLGKSVFKNIKKVKLQPKRIFPVVDKIGKKLKADRLIVLDGVIPFSAQGRSLCPCMAHLVIYHRLFFLN